MSKKIRLDLFAEDDAHERFLSALLRRLARDKQILIEIQVRSAQGGRGAAIEEYKKYLQYLHKQSKGTISAPARIVVGIDANCTGSHDKQQDILNRTYEEYRPLVLTACPDPHIEKWYMVDPESFHQVVGATPNIKQGKCDRDYYKNALAEAVREAEHPPVLTGIDFARELVEAMDLFRAEKADASLKQFLRDARSAFASL